MSVSKGKCYLKRKRFLNEVSQEILTTLQRIYFLRNEIISDSTIKEQAQNYAQKIEAVCLTPKYKMSNDEYHNVLVLKTQELCDVLKRNMLPNTSSPIPISASQQQQSIQQNPQESGIDSSYFNDESKDKIINNRNNKDQMLIVQDTTYDAQIPSEMLPHSQQFPVSIQSQATMKKTKSRKSNLRSSSSSKLTLNQKSSLPFMVQYNPKELENAFTRPNNGSNNDQKQYCNNSVENDATNKFQLSSSIQDLNIYDEVPLNIGENAELQKISSIESGQDRASNQNGNIFLQAQVQSQIQPNEAIKATPLKYDFERGNNDATTIFSVSTKSADLFPITEGNFNNAEAFGLPDEGFFENNYLKDGLDFGDPMSFSFM